MRFIGVVKCPVCEEKYDSSLLYDSEVALVPICYQCIADFRQEALDESAAKRLRTCVLVDKWEFEHRS